MQVVKLNRVIPLDPEPVLAAVRETGRLLVAEEVLAPGSVGERLAALLSEERVPVERVALLNLGWQYIPHGSVGQLRDLCGVDRTHIIQKAKEVCASGKAAAGCGAGGTGAV